MGLDVISMSLSWMVDSSCAYLDAIDSEGFEHYVLDTKRGGTIERAAVSVAVHNLLDALGGDMAAFDDDRL